MKRKAWPDSWLTNTVGITGGLFEEREAVQEELLETLRAGPGEAARRGSGGRGEWPGAQPLDAAHDSGVGGVADGVHVEWGVAACCRPVGWGFIRRVPGCSVPIPIIRSKVRRLAPLFARRRAASGYRGGAVLG